MLLQTSGLNRIRGISAIHRLMASCVASRSALIPSHLSQQERLSRLRAALDGHRALLKPLGGGAYERSSSVVLDSALAVRRGGPTAQSFVLDSFTACLAVSNPCRRITRVCF